MDMFEAKMGGYGNGGWLETTDLKCKDCDYCSYDSWNNPHGHFCECVNYNDNVKDAFLVSRINKTDKVCEKYAPIGKE